MFNWFSRWFRTEMTPKGWVSWYQSPLADSREYLCKDFVDSEFYYSPDSKKAHIFNTRKDALLATPVYDGSLNIEKRSGVFATYE